MNNSTMRDLFFNSSITILIGIGGREKWLRKLDIEVSDGRAGAAVCKCVWPSSSAFQESGARAMLAN